MGAHFRPFRVFCFQLERKDTPIMLPTAQTANAATKNAPIILI
jgi:hypothetical protein